ncbi:MAG TPA: hypothetical protein DCP92_18045 [Nitrospiraceae bacterium]|jgi:hypothetical protein|nr:hypothetical protein [Nitrospiraceae bacterium]
MSFTVRVVIFVLGLIFFLILFEMVRRKKFREELSITWFIVGIALMASSVADKVVDPLARVLGIGYPPALVLVWIVFLLMLALVYFSYVISDLKGKVKELSQKLALTAYEVEKQNRGKGV